jgi:hypothetical protein
VVQPPVCGTNSKVTSLILNEIPKSVVFRRVKWSGGNSAFARREGITNFEKIAAEYPERPLYVVSQSHGANVVLAGSENIRKAGQISYLFEFSDDDNDEGQSSVASMDDAGSYSCDGTVCGIIY